MTTTHLTSAWETLEHERAALRGRLARAWELRAPDEYIRDLEEQMRTVWARLEAIDPGGAARQTASA